MLGRDSEDNDSLDVGRPDNLYFSEISTIEYRFDLECSYRILYS
jgi:hypothetical protein